MPNFVSPGVYIIEKDISDYPAQINSSVVGIVGFASRGPIAGISSEKATLITSQQGLIDTFGAPNEGIKGQALEGALEILEATNSLRFIRCADATRLEASAAVSIGGCPAILLSGTHAVPIAPGGYTPATALAANLGMSAIGSADSTTSGVKFVISAYDNARTLIKDAVTYTIASGSVTTSASEGATSILGLKKAIGGALDADTIGAWSSDNGVDASCYIVGAAAGGTATLSVRMYLQDDSGAWTNSNGLRVLDQVTDLGTAGNSVTASGTTADNTAVSYFVKSLWAGEGYNAGTKADGTTSGTSFEVAVNGGYNTLCQVNDQGVAAENFITGTTSSSFIEDNIGTTYTGRTSNYVFANFATGQWDDAIVTTELATFEKPLSSLFAAGVTLTGGQGGVTGATINPRFVKLVQGSYSLAGGLNGIPTAAADIATVILGATQSDGGKTGFEALDDPVLNVSIACAPGPGVGDNQTIQNGLITVAERTTDFLAAISPPYAIGKPGDAIDWSNGYATSRTAAVNSSYAAIYWPWVKVFQVWDGKDRWLAPEIYGIRQMAVTDSVSDPWFAPAGFVRGRLTKPTDVEVVLNQGDRDSLYSGGNVINPIVNFPQNGIAIFGQRTSQRDPTALDRINVRRMMIYIKKVILASTQRLVFEPNDKFTWTRVTELINPLLGDILRRRGITQFSVTCDETTNTPIRIDRNEMWCKVLIKPTKTAEMVIFELNLTSQSAQIG